MQDQKLIKKLQEGDHSAFKKLFDDYKIMVFNVCLSMLSNQQEAEDITQDVFFQAYKSIKRFRAESRLSTWLYRIAVNHCLNHQRRKKQARWLSLDFILESQGEKNQDVQTLSVIASGDSPDVVLEKSERKRVVQQAINSLPKKQRIVVILHRYEGLSYKEIAEVMKCSLASVESRLHRAKVNLTKKLLPILKEI